MTNISDHIEKLKKIDENFKLYYLASGLGLSILDQDFISSCGKQRFIPGSIFNGLNISIRTGVSIFSNICGINLLEYSACCGKLLGSNMFCVTRNVINEEKSTTTFKILLEIVELVCIGALYTSFSFIVSEQEQPHIHKIISEMDDYKIINQFKNQRMPQKNICTEYCKNFFGN